MAKTQGKEESKDLTTTEAPGALVSTDKPDWLVEGDKSGTEDIDSNELRFPRLSIAQGLSPQLQEGTSYIPDLKINDMFNDLSSEIYGKGPLNFIVVKRDVKRIEFKPRSEGGGVLDMDVPLGDPRLEWTEDESGKRIPPRATKFVEFVIVLFKPTGPEPIVLSIKDTNKFNRRAHDRLTAFIKSKNAPIYSVVYSVKVVPEKNDKGIFGVFVIDQVGWLKDKKTAENAKEFHEALKTKKVQVAREPGDDDIDGAVDEAPAATTGGKVPF